MIMVQSAVAVPFFFLLSSYNYKMTDSRPFQTQTSISDRNAVFQMGFQSHVIILD